MRWFCKTRKREFIGETINPSSIFNSVPMEDLVKNAINATPRPPCYYGRQPIRGPIASYYQGYIYRDIPDSNLTSRKGSGAASHKREPTRSKTFESRRQCS